MPYLLRRMTTGVALVFCLLGGGRHSPAENSRLPLKLRRPQAEAVDNKLYLHYAVFDPLRERPQVHSQLVAPSSNRLFIVQLAGTVDDVKRAFLRQHGAYIRRYLPENAYLVEMNPAQLTPIRSSDFVRWAGPYEPAYRIEPTLDTAINQESEHSDQGVPCVVQVVRKGQRSLQTTAALIRELGGIVQVLPKDGYRLIARLTRGQLHRTATFNNVCYIERVNPQWLQNMGGRQRKEDAATPVITMQTIREMCGANYVEQVAGYKGQGVCGSIIDQYVRYDHDDFIGHPIRFAGPVVSGPGFHGTGVTGILFGTGAADNRARGLLPEGQPVFTCDRPVYSVSGTHFNIYELTRELLRPPYQTVFQSSSTGGGYASTYDILTAEMDDVVLDYDMLVCQALGNSGERTQESPGWAKNVVSVGGMDHANTADKADDHWARGASCGPTDDRRIKPDLVQFCTGVYCTNAATRRDYETFMGTSAATPLTAGHFGLMYQMWADGLFGNPVKGKTVFSSRPHAATAKALMINTATPYEFEGDDPNRGRYKQGWGLTDVRNLYDLRHKFFIVDQSELLKDHQTKTFSLQVTPGEPCLKATLAYTDVPGATCATRFLVNSLVLKVTSPQGIL